MSSTERLRHRGLHQPHGCTPDATFIITNFSSLRRLPLDEACQLDAWLGCLFPFPTSFLGNFSHLQSFVLQATSKLAPLPRLTMVVKRISAKNLSQQYSLLPRCSQCQKCFRETKERFVSHKQISLTLLYFKEYRSRNCRTTKKLGAL